MVVEIGCCEAGICGVAGDPMLSADTLLCDALSKSRLTKNREWIEI
jgi:hypothetical protein